MPNPYQNLLSTTLCSVREGRRSKIGSGTVFVNYSLPLSLELSHCLSSIFWLSYSITVTHVVIQIPIGPDGQIYFYEVLLLKSFAARIFRTSFIAAAYIVNDKELLEKIY